MAAGIETTSPLSDWGHGAEGTPSLRSTICEVTARLCAEKLGTRLRAIVLTGSLARDEATCVEHGEYCRVLGDAEFLPVFESAASLRSVPAIELMRQKIEDSLWRRGILCHVGLSAVHPNYFRRLPPSIFAYELIKCGQVVWGDREILALVPAFSAEDIPREDAWRLLSNRMIELLEVAPLGNKEQVTGNSAGRPSSLFPIPSSVPYSAVKLYLDMATSFLLFQGAYEPTYRGREARLRSLAENTGDQDGYPFSPLRGFSERVTACTEFKLGTAGRNGPHVNLGARASRPLDEEWTSTSTLSWEEIFADARALWRWELERLTGCRGTACRTLSGNLVGPEEMGTASRTPTDRELMRKWMRLQPLGQRLHGWAYVLRQCGWHRSWREWPRWVRFGWRASPRYWIYAAASELFFKLGELLAPAQEPGGAADLDCQELRSRLPQVGKHEMPPDVPAWQGVAREIGWNYHEFLEGTRA
jgi:hypothetical protein